MTEVKHIAIQINLQNWKSPHSSHQISSHCITPENSYQFVPLDGVHSFVEATHLF